MLRTPLTVVSVPLIGLSFAAVAACSGATTGGVSASQASSDIAGALCARIQACVPLYIQIAYGDVTTCTSRESTVFTNTLSAPGTGWTPDAAEACAKAIPGASCDDALGHNLPAVCHAPAGQLANGAACGDSGQCTSSYCNLGDSGQCGTCAAALGAVGAACYRDDDCVFGAVCMGASLTAATSTAGKCGTPGGSGATCSPTAPCLSTLACIGGTCTAPVAAGASCSQVPDVFGACGPASGDYCSKKTGGTCTMLGVAGKGQACGDIGGTLTICSASGTCNMGTGTGTTMGTCTAPAADFGTCTPNMVGCDSPSTCIGGKCVMPTPATCK